MNAYEEFSAIHAEMVEHRPATPDKVQQADIEFTLDTAYVLLQTGGPREAIALLEPWLRSHPDHARLRTMLALSFIMQGQLLPALRQARAAIRLAPFIWTPPVTEAEQLSQAVARQRLVQLEAQELNAQNAYELGQCRALHGDYAGALEAYRVALRNDKLPHRGSLLTSIGTVLRVFEQPQLALRWHEAALRCEPKLALAYNNLVCAYSDLKRVRDAVRAAQCAVELAPRSGYPCLNLGIGYLEMASYDLAQFEIERAVNIDPNLMPEAAVYQAAAHTMKGEAEDALELLRTAQRHPMAHRVPQLGLVKCAALASLESSDLCDPADDALTPLWEAAL